MSSTYRLGELKRLLVVIEESVDQDRPVLVQQYWPTTYIVHDLRMHYGIELQDKDPLAGFQVKKVTNGSFAIHHPRRSNPAAPWTQIDMCNGASTRTVKYEEVPLEPPKARVPVVWKRGQWWKETRKGLVRV